MSQSLSTNSPFHQALDLFFEKKYEEALVIFISLLDEKVEHVSQAEILRRIGSCLAELNRIEESVKYLEQAREMYKKFEHEDNIWILQSLAHAYAKQERFTEAFSLYESIIKAVEDPDDFDYLVGEYEQLIDKYRLTKYKKVIDVKRKAFLDQVQDKIQQVDKEIQQEEARLWGKRIKLEV